VGPSLACDPRHPDLLDGEAFRFNGLAPHTAGLFLKLSYPVPELSPRVDG
jgi:hypothetical protein